MSGYVPDAEEVRDSLVYLNKYYAKQHGDVDLIVVESETAGQFDRWLAEVRRQAAEEALLTAAEDLRVSFSRGAAIAMHHECHKRQCRCGNPGNDEIVRAVFAAARDSIRDMAAEYQKAEE